MRRNRAAIPLFLLMTLALGCGEAFERGEGLSLDKVPDAALKAAKKALPEVDFDSAWKEKEGGSVAYEIRGHTREGKFRDIKVSPEGKVLEID
jgi:hypothetical protein